MLNSIGNFLPEIALILTVIILPLNQSLLNKYKIHSFHLAGTGIFLSLLLSFFQIWSEPNRIFGMMFVTDPFSVFAKITIVFSVFAILLISKKTVASAEFYIFVTSLTLGCLLAASSMNMLMLYVSFALVDLSLFFLITIDKINFPIGNSHIKFVTYIIVSSLIMLLGMSILYGIAGSMEYNSISIFLSMYPSNPTTLLFAILLILVAFASRILLVPFQFSAGKVIEHVPLSVFAVLTMPVVFSVFISFTRFFYMAFKYETNGLLAYKNYLQIPDLHINQIMIALAVITLVYSSIAIWRQKNLKKIIFYIIILQSSFITLALSIFSITGIADCLVMIIVFFFTDLGLIYILNTIETTYKTDSIKELAGKGKSNKLLFFALIIFLFSSAGLPLTFGFTSRLFLCTDLINSGSVWIVVILVINTVIMAFFTFKILKDIFIIESEKPSENIPKLIGEKLILLIILLPAILFGFYFEPLIKIAQIFSKIYKF